MTSHRLIRILRICAKHVYIGLVHVGWSMAPGGIAAFARQSPPERQPGPGHPERLTPEISLSEAERQLWRQLLPWPPISGS
jgi:hypothetical protein